MACQTSRVPDPRESINVLHECADLQKRKSQDYQNQKSNVRQSDHYRRGVSTIHDMISQKLLRAQSLIEPLEADGDHTPNFESLEDTYKDLINYASFAVAYIRGKMEGQDPNRDMFNRPKSYHQALVETVLKTNALTDIGDRMEEAFNADIAARNEKPYIDPKTMEVVSREQGS